MRHLAQHFSYRSPGPAATGILKRACVVVLLALSMNMFASAQAPPADLSKLSVEDLMNIEVSSVSKKEQKISQAAAAIFVITKEDISRSGALNIPDLLRMVPGLNVAQINANTWAISSRGFNGEFSDELLVLLDGRSVYIPTTSGVFWDVLDIPLEDLERIEVIRGPGGATWGANAVNGVINIITKKASATLGGMVVAGGGNQTQEFGTVQYGAKIGQNTDYRVFSKYLDEDHQPGLNAPDGGDGWHALRAGFRSDSQLSVSDDLTFTGDVYSAREGDITNSIQSVASPTLQETFAATNLDGGYLQADWNHRYAGGSDSTLQVSFDRYRRNDVLRETRNTLNIDFEDHFSWGGHQDIVWGLGYRFSSSTTDGDLSFSLNPPDLDTQLFSGFVQDEFALIPTRLSLTAGMKVEHNYYTGFGVMPTARVAWTPHEHQMVWAAVSRALETPSSTDTAENLTLSGFVPPVGPPVLVRIVGNPAFQNERHTAYEFGYRTQLLKRLSLDLATYYNSGHQLPTTEPEASFIETDPPPVHLVLPLQNENAMYGETHGVEIFASWKATDRWTITPGYTYEGIHLHVDPGSQDTQSVPAAEGSSPRQWARVDSHLTVVHSLAWDASANFVGRLASGAVPSYTRVDTQLTWRRGEHVSVSIVGQNLVRDEHLEFSSTADEGPSNVVKRSAYAKLTWIFTRP